MDRLWILTEEKPKISVIETILKLYCRDFNDTVTFSEIKKIVPVINGNTFQFHYKFEGARLKNCTEIILATISGSSSFFDFLVFKQENKPEGTSFDNLLMAIEETKTNGDESRNTGVYQRGSKFVFVENYYNNIKKYMLYNEELQNDENKKPADTITFGTNMFLSLDIDIVGKETDKWFKKFNSIDELIDFKNNMKKPPKGNVPIMITKNGDKIEVSGRLAKPADAGNIAHDPNIGALSLICKSLRYLGWTKDIIITDHGVTQSYIDKTKGNNKFLYICKILNLKLQNIILPNNIRLPEKYWHYETRSEKIASILLHILGENSGMRGIYQNHAGCERGYFISKTNELIALPKKDKNNVNLYIPDLILHCPEFNEIILIEGKQLSTIQAGLSEIEDYDSIENEFIKIYYPDCKIFRYLSIFGGKSNFLPDSKVLFYLNDYGNIIINPDAPDSVKQASSIQSLIHNYI